MVLRLRGNPGPTLDLGLQGCLWCQRRGRPPLEKGRQCLPGGRHRGHQGRGHRWRNPCTPVTRKLFLSALPLCHQTTTGTTSGLVTHFRHFEQWQGRLPYSPFLVCQQKVPFGETSVTSGEIYFVYVVVTVGQEIRLGTLTVSLIRGMILPSGMQPASR